MKKQNKPKGVDKVSALSIIAKSFIGKANISVSPDPDLPAEIGAKEEIKQLSLFPNKNPLPETYIQVKRESSDFMSALIQADKSEIGKSRSKNEAKLTRSNGNDVKLLIDGTFGTKDAFDKEVLARREADFLQMHLTLESYCNDRGSFSMTNVKLTDLMKYRYKLPKSGYFTDKKQKQAFTASLMQYAATKIAVEIQQPVVDANGQTKRDKKGKPKTEKQTAFVQLMRLERAVFAKGNTDKSVIVRLFAKMNPQLTSNSRGRLFPRYLLELNSARDRREILIGYFLANRADQLRHGIERNKKKGIPDKISFKVSRGQLIRIADIEGTDQADASTASKRLMQSLENLKGKVIVSYSKLRSNSNDEMIQFTAFTDVPDVI